MIIAVDTGGTKTAIASFNNSGEITSCTKFPTPKSTQEYIKSVSTSIKNMSHNGDISAITIAIPGIIKNDIAAWCKNLGWKNFDVINRLRKYFPHTPIFIENDANLGGLSEAILQRVGDKKVLYVTVSTGVGTGFIQNNQIVPFLQLSEGGQMILEHNDIMQSWSSFASGRAIYDKYKKFGCDISDEKTWLEISSAIASGLYVIIPLVQPDVIIFGGSIGTYTQKFKKNLTILLSKNLPEYIVRPKILKAAHPEQAVLFGGYEYAISKISNK